MRAVVEVGVENVTSTIVATRGSRLALTRITGSNGVIGAGELSAEVLNLVEINADNQILSKIGFDVDDIDAAFEELDARYLAGEAAAHAHIWTAITRVLRREQPTRIPRDDAGLGEYRPPSGIAFAPGDVTAYIRATYDVAPNVKAHVEAVHRLGNLGVVVTEVVAGTSQEGFDAEWREDRHFRVRRRPDQPLRALRRGRP